MAFAFDPREIPDNPPVRAADSLLSLTNGSIQILGNYLFLTPSIQFAHGVNDSFGSDPLTGH